MITRLVLLVFGATLAAQAQPAAKKSTTAKPVAASSVSIARAQIKQLTLRQKVAQLVIAVSYGEMPPRRSKEFLRLDRAVRVLGVGGLIVVNGVDRSGVKSANPQEMIGFLNRMQKLSKLPLIVGADFERGASMRVSNTTKYPHNMAFAATGDLASTHRLGAATAREARTLGVHWVFAPVADVNNNPDNPIINIRSFGQNPNDVAEHVKAYIAGARSDPAYKVLLCVKHFPGHGDTEVDSHRGMPLIEASRERLNRVELVPFRAAIAAKVDSIMTGHFSVPALEPEAIPATVSKNVMTKLLRQELKFEGLLTTDAMDMAGLSKMFSGGESAVRALEAGVDVLLMPRSPEVVVEAVVQAVLKKRLTVQRIEKSVEKLLVAKADLGLFSKRLVNADVAPDFLDTEEDNEAARNVANRSVAIFKNEANLVPVRNLDQSCIVVLAERRTTTQGLVFLEEMAKLAPKASVVLLDPTMPQGALDEVQANGANCSLIVVAAFAALGSYRGASLPGKFPALVDGLIASGKPVVLLSLGNPYLLNSFPKVKAYITTYSTVQASETAAARALVGEIPITGHRVISLK